MRNAPLSPLELRRKTLLETRARQHRAALNFPEQLLWQELSAAKLGVHFRRQVVVGGRYIADYLAPSIRLVVEVDGRCHDLKRSADARRDRKLRGLGYHVLRVDAQLVLGNLENAVAVVRAAIERLR